MHREGHHVLGASCGLLVAQGAVLTAGWTWPQALVFGAVAALTAGGPLSPDIDQYGPWRTADDVLPDELLGRGGPMQHRGITHWWGLQAAAAVALAYTDATLPGPWWLAWAALTGWASHLIGDFLFGRAVYARTPSGALVRVVGEGIPMSPWWNHRGLGIARSAGRTSTAATFVLHFTATGQAVLILVTSGGPW